MIDVAPWQEWIGREEVSRDWTTAAQLHDLAATLDYDAPPWPSGVLPPLGHWLYFHPTAKQSALGADGHPNRGGFLPPLPLPHRMWAGSTVEFLAAIPIGGCIKRRSKIAAITPRSGASGDLVFVRVEHTIMAADVLAVREQQDLVYRDAGSAAHSVASPAAIRPGAVSRQIVPDATLLFRYSALTFNAHRIHYDRTYAREVEGYRDLVVHGPLLATLLLDLALRPDPARRVAEFAFSARRPLFASAAATLCLDEGERDADSVLWARDAEGFETMKARVRWASAEAS